MGAAENPSSDGGDEEPGLTPEQREDLRRQLPYISLREDDAED
ncbi:hypothetical protein [Micromonospora sp. Mcm103]|nr:hypothetical protein [Micromonospora sp. Mcm103]